MSDDPIVDLLRRAADRAMGYWRTGPLEYRDKAPAHRAVDLVTEADLAVDRLITRELARLHPDVTMISEEGDTLEGLEPPADAFVLDPIDGTHNFAQGTPWWTISLARTRGHEIEEGWLIQPSTGTLWHAARGGQTTRDGEPIHVSTAELRMGLVSLSLSREMLPLLLQSQRFAGIRALGSHALCLALAAEGSFVLHAGGGHPWDVAAGHLLIERAGGRVCDLDGGVRSPFVRTQTLSGAPHAVDAALEIFAAG